MSRNAFARGLGVLAVCSVMAGSGPVAKAGSTAAGVEPSSVAGSRTVLLKAGGYSAGFRFSAGGGIDGMDALRHEGAPEAMCVPAPCAAKSGCERGKTAGDVLTFAPVCADALKSAGCGHDAKAAWAAWTSGGLSWKCRLTADGLESVLSGKGDVAMRVPAFASDGAAESEISQIGKTLVIRYGGWVCAYLADGRFADTGKTVRRGNARYRVFEAHGTEKLSVKVWIRRETACVCGEAPERRNDFYWENDRTGFRAYGPGDTHKWSGIDVFNKATAANMVCRFLREKGKYGNWHKNKTGLGMDNYAVGPGRGLGGVALRKDGKWLADYGNWVAYRVLENSDARCAFELDYKLPIGGIMTLGITLPRGSQFFRETVSFSKDVPLEGVEAGVGIDLNAKRGHAGDVFVDAEKGIVSLFENPYGRKEEQGSLMSAVFIAPGTDGFSLVDEPNGAKMFLTRPLKASDADGRPVITVYAGADWTEAGRHRTAAEWHGHVKRAATAALD